MSRALTLSSLKHSKLSKLSTNVVVDALEACMLSEKQAECPVVHTFGPSLYIRELSMKAGTVAIGHYQNFKHQNILLKGAVRVLNDNGTFTDLRSPLMFTGEPGRKVGYVLEDLVWLNVYSTEETDVEVLESTLVTKSSTFCIKQELKRMQERLLSLEDNDYELFLKERGLTQADVDRDMAMVAVDDMSTGSYSFVVADSPIHGKGLFATANIEAGASIGPALLTGAKTRVGRFVNHSKNPNAIFKEEVNGDIYLYSKLPIQGCSSGTLGAEITVNYRDNLQFINRGRICLS